MHGEREILRMLCRQVPAAHNRVNMILAVARSNPLARA